MLAHKTDLHNVSARQTLDPRWTLKYFDLSWSTTALHALAQNLCRRFAVPGYTLVRRMHPWKRMYKQPGISFREWREYAMMYSMYRLRTNNRLSIPSQPGQSVTLPHRTLGKPNWYKLTIYLSREP